MSFLTAMTSFSRRSTVALSSMLFFPEFADLLLAEKTPAEAGSSSLEAASIVGQLRRFDRHQMLFQDQGDDQEGRGQETAHRAPQPGPERQRQQHGQPIQRQLPPDDGGGDEMSFQERDAGKGDRRRITFLEGHFVTR